MNAMTISALAPRIAAAVARAEGFLWSLQAPHQPAGVFRTSHAHDPARWPGVLLPGSYDALMALALTGGIARFGARERALAAAFIKRFRLGNGVFTLPEHRPENTYKRPEREETDRYIAFHLTNYALGALEALGDDEEPWLGFARPFLDPLRLDAWLARRDLRDPWLEGNNIVNLASFLLLTVKLGGDDAAGARAALARLVEWHHFNQEPATGFWGVGQGEPRQHLHAMAGATHNFHLFYALGAPIPYTERIVDYCLGLPMPVQSACIDVDIVDILANFHAASPYRRADIEAWLAGKLAALLAFQNSDGGFADVTDGVRRLDGWVEGYSEPQGLSNSFATFFRLIAIAMIAATLAPDLRRWGFRRMLGIGYFPEQR
jgi:hypothetical protein